MLTMRSIRSFLFAIIALGVPVVMLTAPGAAFAQVSIGVSVRIAPPVLPVYEQPVCPGDGYIWTPGYWAYGPDGYYWVPGTWVLAPTPGFLWTPGHWGWGDGVYVWHAGYWGPHVGFYGGVNYGFGYVGVGYEGGYWNHGVFNYNRSVNNIHITNVHVYNKTVINNVTVNRVSFNGGNGGTRARPSATEVAAEREHHVPETSAQSQHEHAAGGNRAQFASVNGGRPTVAATDRPGDFNHAVPARTGGAPDNGRGNAPNSTRSNGGAATPAYRPPANRGGGNQPDAHTVNPGGSRGGNSGQPNADRPNGGAAPAYRPPTNRGGGNAAQPNSGRPDNSKSNGGGRATITPPPAHNAPSGAESRAQQPAPRQQESRPQPQPSNKGGGQGGGGQQGGAQRGGGGRDGGDRGKGGDKH
jgi:uncharacterized membrane protein YgcG